MLRHDVVLSRFSHRYRNDALGNLSSARLFSCLCLLAGTIKWHKLAQWWCHLPVKPVFLNFFKVFLLIMIFGISSKNTPTKLITNNWLFSWWERQCSPQVNWPSGRPGFYRLWECSGGNGTSRMMVESVTLFQRHLSQTLPPSPFKQRSNIVSTVFSGMKLSEVMQQRDQIPWLSELLEWTYFPIIKGFAQTHFLSCESARWPNNVHICPW